MNKFFSAILRVITPSRRRRALLSDPAALQERIRRLEEERTRLEEMIPHLKDFEFDDEIRDHEKRIAEIDEEVRAIERELKRVA